MLPRFRPAIRLLFNDKGARKVAHEQTRKPLPDLDKILQDRRYLRHNHLRNFWLRSVRGFSGAERRQISPFPVGFYRRPYDTLALPREYLINLYFSYCILCLQCFDAVGWAAGRACGL